MTSPPDIAAIVSVLARNACRDVVLLHEVGETAVTVRRHKDWTVIVCLGEIGEQIVQALRDRDASIHQPKESQ